MEAFGAAVGCVQLLEGCLEAYQFITTAMNIGSDGYRLVSRLDWEHFRLSQWSEQSGLSHNEPSACLNWACATSLLVKQEGLLTSADKLKEKYNLNVSEEKIAAQSNEPKFDSANEFSRCLRSLRPAFRKQAIQRKNSTVRKLRWAGVGRSQIARIIDDLRTINDGLYFLLDSADREKNQKLQNELLRQIISSCAHPQGIESVQSVLKHQEPNQHHALAAAAALREVLLIIESGRQRGQTTQPTAAVNGPTLRQLHLSRLVSSTVRIRKGVEIAQYDGQTVVVEWRAVDKPRWSQFEKAMQRLAFLLTAMDKDTFHTLPCFGLIASEQAGYFGFVYQVPPDEPKPNVGFALEYTHTTLHNLLAERHFVSLSKRIQIAVMIMESLLQLHTAGWLHKGIRSENILFFSPADYNDHQIISKAYLLGFEYSRPDSKAGALLTEPSTGPLLTDIYRHPAARGLSREQYSKQFDMYSMGCLLIELALWKQLIEILPISHSAEVASAFNPLGDLHGKIPEAPSFLEYSSFNELRTLVSYHAGDSFCEAVDMCFVDCQGSASDHLKSQHRVLETLRACRQSC